MHSLFKLFTNKIYKMIIFITGILTAFLYFFLKGKASERNKQNNRVFRNVKEARKVVDNLTDSDRDRLRKKYRRK